MKKILTLSALLSLAIMSSAQIVVNEIIFTPAPAIELKNLGTTTVDVSTLQLCSFPEYNELQSLTIVSGNLMLGPGEFLVVSGHSFTVDDDEMGLYTSGPYNVPGNMLDYVEWGSTGHTRSATAVSAGIWSTGFLVNVDAGGSSIEYDGEGNAPSDWLLNGTNSQGAENSNAGGGCEASAFVVGSQFVCEGESATFQLILTGIGPWTFTYSHDGVIQDPVTTSLSPHPWMLSDEGSYDLMTVVDANCEGEANGTVSVTFISPPTALLSGLSEFCSTDENASLLIDFTGQGPWTYEYAIDGVGQGEATVADNPLDIPVTTEGSYTMVSVYNNSCDGTVSGTIDVAYSPLGGGVLTYMGATTAVSICVDDGLADLLTFDLADSAGENADIVVTDEAGIVLAIPGTNAIDFEGNEAGTCLVWNLSYSDGLTGLAVDATLPDDLEGCFELSNAISVIRQTGDDCTTSIEEFVALQDLNLFPNPVSDLLNVSYTLDDRMTLEFTISDLRGKVIARQNVSSFKGAELLQFDVDVMTKGAYILRITSSDGDSVQRMFMK